MINILYIHGYNSNSESETARVLASELGSYATVYHPTFEGNPIDIEKQINEYIMAHHINLIVASSLGGFFALRLNSYFKIVINPCVEPHKYLNQSPFVDKYKEMEKTLFSLVDCEERALTYGVFSRADELFSYYDVFCKHYMKQHTIQINDRHRISARCIKNVLVPLIHQIFEVDSPILKKQLECTPFPANLFGEEDLEQGV